MEPVDAGLSAALEQVFGTAALADLVRLTGGASRETWRCTVEGEAFVVQRQRAESERDMQVEAAVVRAAHANGVESPQVIACVDSSDGTTTLVTRHVDGETIARKLLRDDEYAEARGALVGDLGRALARLHRIDPDSVPGLEFADPLDHSRDQLDELGEPHPTFELALRWLDEHRPPVAGRAIVHGDFRLGNVIVDHRGLAAVIDWELAHVGDPMEDLGWLCVPAWRFGSDLPAAGVGTREQLIDGYAEEAGVDVDREVIRWWEVSGILRWGVICMVQADAHRTGIVRSHELAAIGRRVCETEHDLFLALDGRW